ncbi:MAG: LysR family transcriptional regulator [Pseudomonadota bacterium]|uniref:LysR family transcriptional regulator n=1 Tax=Gallaecimonas pentaromativorans TaxID=584787 RepID=A0A3N1PQR5_9GAMM|nr:LysR family transcriptional regulator [Gallaecimonas pentaromativorans]MED5526994.1 LysR family transcriptional regulator [Pseudomonadota bacterium]ROQ30853.1 LysR family transcriptional regulator [Gallaecimonas pentaromativorans]
MKDPLAGISAFVAVADAGGFAAASEQLHLTRAAVGKIIAQLEERLAVRLFHRTTRSFALTEEGRRFYANCRRALALVEAGLNDLDSRPDEPRGLLKITAPVLFGRHFVAPVITQLAERFSGLQVQMHLTDQSLDLVESGFDLAVRMGSLDDSSGLVCRRLAPSTIVVCAAPSYLERYGQPQTLEQLSGHQTLEYSASRRSGPWANYVSRPGFRLPQTHSRFQVDNLDALVDAAVAGLGLAFLPLWLVAPRLQQGELVEVLPEQRKMLECSLVWPQNPHVPLKTRFAIDALVEALGA